MTVCRKLVAVGVAAFLAGCVTAVKWGDQLSLPTFGNDPAPSIEHEPGP